MPHPKEPGLAELIGSLADGLGTLLTEHIALAKLELEEDARAFGGQLARLLAFVPFLVIGYLFLCAAAAAALSRWIGWGGSLLLLGGLHAVVGGVGVIHAVNQLKRRHVMSTTVEAFRESAHALTRAAEAAPLPAVPAHPEIRPEVSHGG